MASPRYQCLLEMTPWMICSVQFDWSALNFGEYVMKSQVASASLKAKMLLQSSSKVLAVRITYNHYRIGAIYPYSGKCVFLISLEWSLISFILSASFLAGRWLNFGSTLLGRDWPRHIFAQRELYLVRRRLFSAVRRLILIFSGLIFVDGQHFRLEGA